MAKKAYASDRKGAERLIIPIGAGLAKFLKTVLGGKR